MEIRSISSFLEYADKFHERTARVVRLIPPDRLEWTFKAGKFTCGDLVRHIAGTERWMWAENVSGRPSRYPGHQRSLADGYDAVIRYYDDLHVQARALFASLSEDDLQRHCQTPGGGGIRVWKWLRAMLEHEAHHRGQLYLYLSMLDVPTPALYGLTSEQVRERSQA
jgi:uncharacterized damage-inducible protein DinB